MDHHKIIQDFLSKRGYPHRLHDLEHGLILYEVAFENEINGEPDFLVLVDEQASPPCGKFIMPLTERVSEELNRELLMANLELEVGSFALSEDPAGYVATAGFTLDGLSEQELERCLEGTVSAALLFFEQFGDLEGKEDVQS